MAVNPGNAAAQKLVNQLHAGGMSYAEIGRRVGRDSSLISQIGNKGNKGASMVGALQKISGGATSVDVTRRTTKGGVAAKVRGGVKTIPGTDNITYTTKRGNKTIAKGLNAINGKGKYVKWRLTYKKVTTDSPGNKPRESGIDGRLPRGWTSDKLADRIQNPQAGDNWKAGDAVGALRSIALQQNGHITSATGLVNVHIYSVD